MKNSKNYILLLLLSFLIYASCKKKNDPTNPSTDCEAINIDLFSLADDRKLGQQVDSQIFASPGQYTILDTVKYDSAYQHLHRVINAVLNSGKLTHRNDFLWKTRIIKDDSTLNAFCTPGGYIFVYSGIIKYLDQEDDLAGVLGHEIAHADNRHTTKTMTTQYGVGALLNLLLGKKDSSMLVNIASNLASLKYSRCHEAQADEYSVIYLSGTSYECNGAASFFKKIVSAGGSKTPAFLSDHPDPGNRIASINAKAAALGCDTLVPYKDAQYQAFKNSLP